MQPRLTYRISMVFQNHLEDGQVFRNNNIEELVTRMNFLE